LKFWKTGFIILTQVPISLMQKLKSMKQFGQEIWYFISKPQDLKNTALPCQSINNNNLHLFHEQDKDVSQQIAISVITDRIASIGTETYTGQANAKIQKMKDDAAANADQDKKTKERVDKINHADALIFQTEKQLKEFGDKIPADKKGPIEDALKKLKDAHKSEDLDGIDKASAELNTVFQAASQEMYNQGASGNDQNTDFGDNNKQTGSEDENKKSGEDDVQDVDYEEVK